MRCILYRALRPCCYLISSAIALAACGGDDDAPDPPGVDAQSSDVPDGGDRCAAAEELQALLDRERSAIGAAGATAIVVDRAGDCSWTGASGLADVVEDVAVSPADRFRIGSLTKTFTAAVVLQLVDDGVLRLDEALEIWVPGVVNGPDITIEQLLRHTSGIYDYLDDEFFGRLEEEWTPEELVAYANEHAPEFAPGMGWSYSNTNYTLLGMIIERATGDAYHEEVRSRILEPLGLGDTFVEGQEEIPGGFVRGYAQVDGSYVDIRDRINPSAPWASGAIVSTVEDIAGLARGLFGGELLSPDRVEEMTTRTRLPDGTSVDYGMAIIIEESPYGLLQGNNGRIIGFRSDFVHVPDRDATVAVLVNDFEADPQQIRDALLEAAATAGPAGSR